jgi:hypothetical protein
MDYANLYQVIIVLQMEQCMRPGAAWQCWIANTQKETFSQNLDTCALTNKNVLMENNYT